NDTATTEIYPLSLHDALPIYQPGPARLEVRHRQRLPGLPVCVCKFIPQTKHLCLDARLLLRLDQTQHRVKKSAALARNRGREMSRLDHVPKKADSCTAL